MEALPLEIIKSEILTYLVDIDQQMLRKVSKQLIAIVSYKPLRWDNTPVEMIHLNIFNKRVSRDTASYLARIGRLAELKSIVASGCKMNSNITEQAAMSGNLELLKWVVDRGSQMDGDVIKFAAIGGNIDMLKWIVSKGIEICPDMIAFAASQGHLEFLKWAVSNKCEMSSEITRHAAATGHIEILKWAISNGCEWHEKAFYEAWRARHYDLLKWAVVNGCEPSTEVTVRENQWNIYRELGQLYDSHMENQRLNFWFNSSDE